MLAGWAAAALLAAACSCACAMPEPDPAQGQQVIIGVDVDQHRLMPCTAQKLGPAMCLRADLVRDRLTIQLPRAAGLRRAREVLQRRAEGLGFWPPSAGKARPIAPRSVPGERLHSGP